MDRAGPAADAYGDKLAVQRMYASSSHARFGSFSLIPFSHLPIAPSRLPLPIVSLKGATRGPHFFCVLCIFFLSEAGHASSGRQSPRWKWRCGTGIKRLIPVAAAITFLQFVVFRSSCVYSFLTSISSFLCLRMSFRRSDS